MAHGAGAGKGGVDLGFERVGGLEAGVEAGVEAANDFDLFRRGAVGKRRGLQDCLVYGSEARCLLSAFLEIVATKLLPQ
ncbi:MAG: hypothetical protein CVT70_01465 [Alphaproteobacteria bacterium HGW-Alphaproteobacteria-1]|nr:MAG: hypothetical protein CVT70_01465 [Alphaproteobacteria bacterium HGW-Alphaproteobacteria-1]